jgi:NAD(P)-dependent dehydrogenase (short-subunit alcohol dehydrogenase family)
MTGVWNGCQAAIPVLKAQEHGSIVNTASLAGLIGSPGQAAYSMTKGAVVNLTRAIAAELGSHGVRANAVCPGIVETQLVKADFNDHGEWAEIRDRMTENYPLGRLGHPEDVANAVAFLASDEADWITGEALVVDGGYSCA